MPGWEKTFSQLDAWLEQTPGESIVRLPSREVRRVSTEQGVVYVKILYSGSESSGVQKWVTSLKWLIRPSRALAIFNISNEMLREGFLCPRPLLAARHRSRWGWPTDVFISEECLDPTIAQLLLTAEQDLVSSLLTRTAEELHRFHQADFIHGDCTPYNLALTAQNRLVLFDNDRTVRRPGWLCTRQQHRSLANFGLRLAQLTRSLEWFRFFLDRYADASRGALTAADGEGIMALTRRRLRERGVRLD